MRLKYIINKRLMVSYCKISFKELITLDPTDSKAAKAIRLASNVVNAI